MIDPTNPRVIQDSMRAMAGYSQGLIPTLFRQLARMLGAATSPRAQTPTFDRILSQIQPAVIRGLAQQSAVAAQNFVPPTTIEYVSPNILGPDNQPLRLSQRDVDDGLAAGIWTPDYIQRNFRQEQVAEDVPAPERLNVSQVDHVIRTMLRGAEAMGISAERLAGIDWSGIDLNTILTGAVENGEFNLDLSRIPGLDQDIVDAFRSVADGIAASGLQPIIQNAPLGRAQRTQAIQEPEPRQQPIVLSPMLVRLNEWLSRFQTIATPRNAGDDQRTELLNRLATFLGRGANTPVGNPLAPPHHMAHISGPQPDPNRGVLQSFAAMGGRVANAGVRAGNWAFNQLPQFIQNPIITVAQRIGQQGAAATGMNAAGQAAAGQAAANAARVGAGLKLIGGLFMVTAGVVKHVVKSLLSLSEASWAARKRLTQYNGALATAEALSDMRDTLRDIRMANVLSANAAERFAANDRFKDAMFPARSAAFLAGNFVGTQVDNATAAVWDGINKVIGKPLIMIAGTILDAFNRLGAIGDAKFNEHIKALNEILAAIEGNNTGLHPLGGDTVFTDMFNQALRNDMPLQVPPQGGAGPMIPPAGGP